MILVGFFGEVVVVLYFFGEVSVVTCGEIQKGPRQGLATAHAGLPMATGAQVPHPGRAYIGGLSSREGNGKFFRVQVW